MTKMPNWHITGVSKGEERDWEKRTTWRHFGRKLFKSDKKLPTDSRNSADSKQDKYKENFSSYYFKK